MSKSFSGSESKGHKSMATVLSKKAVEVEDAMTGGEQFLSVMVAGVFKLSHEPSNIDTEKFRVAVMLLTG